MIFYSKTGHTSRRHVDRQHRPSGPFNPPQAPREHDKNLIIEWNNILLEAVRALGRLPATSPDRDRGGPPQVARSIAIVHTAMFDAWSAYDAVAKPLHRSTPRKPAAQHTMANRRKAISQAAYRCLIDQFPPEIYQPPFRADYELMLTRQLAQDGIVIGGPTPAPVDVGNQAADDVLAYRHNDNANQANRYADTTGYAPQNRPMPLPMPAAPRKRGVAPSRLPPNSWSASNG